MTKHSENTNSSQGKIQFIQQSVRDLHNYLVFREIKQLTSLNKMKKIGNDSTIFRIIFYCTTTTK